MNFDFDKKITRNFLLINVVTLLFQIFGISINDFKLLGTKIEITQNQEYLIFVFIILYLYLLYRFIQNFYWNHPGSEKKLTDHNSIFETFKRSQSKHLEIYLLEELREKGHDVGRVSIDIGNWIYRRTEGDVDVNGIDGNEFMGGKRQLNSKRQSNGRNYAIFQNVKLKIPIKYLLVRIPVGVFSSALGNEKGMDYSIPVVLMIINLIYWLN